MITKLICPTDFSTEADNAAQYAAKLAQVFNAELLLINVYKLPLASLLVYENGMSSGAKENSQMAADRLKEMRDEINKMFRISCDYEVDVTTKSLSRILAEAGDENSMIVMGTSGTGNLWEFMFGTNTYNAIKRTKCPILLVPNGYAYGTYKNILYTLAYQEKGRLAVNPFHDFVKNFDAYITFLHISEHETDLSREVFRVEREEIEKAFTGERMPEFTRIYSKDTVAAIDGYISKHPTDLLVLAARHRDTIETVFGRKPLLASLSAAPQLPILVLHS